MYSLVLFVVIIAAAFIVMLWTYARCGRPEQGAPRIGGASPHFDAAGAALARQQFVASAQPRDTVTFSAAPSILFYNVHEYIDPAGVNAQNEIGDLIAASSAECTILAEAAPLNVARAVLSCYPHTLTTSNGGTLLAIAWKDPLATAVVVPTTGTRNCILYSARDRRIAAVHLEIGARPMPDAHAAGNQARINKNREIRAANSSERIQQLARLLDHEPDMLIGDFNFELGGAEDTWLRAHGYCAVNRGAPLSTPFNRVDHCYVRAELAKKYPAASNVLFPLAYSDHRPMLQLAHV